MWLSICSSLLPDDSRFVLNLLARAADFLAFLVLIQYLNDGL